MSNYSGPRQTLGSSSIPLPKPRQHVSWDSTCLLCQMYKRMCRSERALYVPNWLHKSHYREAHSQQFLHLEIQAAVTKQELQTSKLMTQAFMALLPHGLLQGFYCNLV